MVAVVSLSILFNIPRYLDDHVVTAQDGSVTIERTHLGNDDTFRLVYAGIFYYLIIYALPVAILAAMTTFFCSLLCPLCSNNNGA